MIKSGKYDSIFTATKEHWLPRWNKNVEPVDWNIHNRPRRQDKSELYVENGMFYITKRENLLRSKLRYSGKMGVVEIPLKDSFQVDNENDLELIRKII
jgi:N-acylneuraminate cytidylyltransferase